ncbi:hypothetical protein ALC57_11037, partial [Trachymyrmex cornetzi]
YIVNKIIYYNSNIIDILLLNLTPNRQHKIHNPNILLVYVNLHQHRHVLYSVKPFSKKYYY